MIRQNNACYFNKIERSAPFETFGKRTIVLHRVKFDEISHTEKPSKHLVKGKLTTFR